jgi:uncharacterized protein
MGWVVPSIKLVMAGTVAGAFALSGLAWIHAKGMTHYLPAGERPTKPEQLTWLHKVKLILTGVQLPRPENRQTPQDAGMAYQTHRLALNPQNNSSEWLETWFVPMSPPKTQAPPKSQGVFLLFPPYGGSKSSLLATAVALHQLGYDTLLVDYRGVGGSSGDTTTIGVKEAEDVVTAVKYVQAQWPGRPIYLYGASMGAAAITRAVALQGVTPKAIILESTFDRLDQAVRNRFTAMGLPSSPGTELMLWWANWQHGIDSFNHNPIDYAKTVSMPTLMLYGQADRRVTLAETQAVFSQLPGQKQLSLFASVGHGGLAATEPEQWRQQVQEFLQNVR